MPDPALCGMMVFEIPATVHYIRDGKASETGISQKTCHKISMFKAFGKKSVGSYTDSSLEISCKQLLNAELSDNDLLKIEVLHLLYSPDFKWHCLRPIHGPNRYCKN
jgi:hypothetical protein